jgi:hypothetical protein
VQDFGTEFHYSWFIILITLVGWGEPKYIVFFHRIGKCCATKYTTLWYTSYSKKMKENSTTFAMLFDEMQENIANTWRIPP